MSNPCSDGAEVYAATLADRLPRALAVLIALVCSPPAYSAGFEALARRFAESEFVFNRARSDVPFVPLAWVDASVYDDTRFRMPSGEATETSFEQTTFSEATLIPLLLGTRDALVLGQWMSWTRFDLSNGTHKDVFSAALPLGWARQATEDRQYAAFIAPLAHSGEDRDFYWEYMAGMFVRWLHGERLAWIFGLYADVAPLEEYYIPYAGVTWTINEHWSLTAIMPWPALLYSPTEDWLIRLGLAPSDASWSVHADGEEIERPEINFGSWNLGLSVERRIWKQLWLSAETGIAGFRGFTFTGSDWEGPNSDLGTDGYVSVSINFRPNLDP